ncbi:MAG: hypothetical protein NC819_03440 [Candidatus Omnitrophica bacterium]|nr:hypothetical protein [Candidatus Omnitrophota bacterium]
MRRRIQLVTCPPRTRYGYPLRVYIEDTDQGIVITVVLIDPFTGAEDEIALADFDDELPNALSIIDRFFDPENNTIEESIPIPENDEIN